MSADEKLRSLGAKHHSSPKLNITSTTNTYRGALVDTPEPNDSSRAPPNEPPPPIPSTTNGSLTRQSCDIDKVHIQNGDEETPPPLYPKPQITQMAERRIHRQTRNEPSRPDSKPNDDVSAKRRSRSEGPHGRRRMRNSMHETSRSSQAQKQPTNTRHSMFTGHISDENKEEQMYLAGSDSPESDDSGRKLWTKNPLVIKRTKRLDKGGTEKRKSIRNSENGIDHDQIRHQKRSSKDIKGNPGSKKKDLYMYNERNENVPSSSQKAKFQKLEERRKKRIDMAVTSDEECSPQLRISRLRQRAMMSSNMFNDKENDKDEPLNIYPANYRNMVENNINNGPAYTQHSNYDDMDVISGGYDNGNTEFLGHVDISNANVPYNKPRHGESASSVTNASKGVFRENQLSGRRILEHPHGGILTYPPVNNQQSHRSAGVNISSESPPMRSFHEVKSNRPKQLKKAVETIELNPRSPNSSSDDSLDELIESNIQYLESEIESGKLKRQSGSFSNLSEDSIPRKLPVIQQQQLPHQGALTASEEIKVRLKGPSPTASKHVATVTKIEPVPKFVQRSNSYTATTTHALSNQVNNQSAVYLNPNATYSPYMHRRNNEIPDDMSKSDSQLNAMERDYETAQNFYRAGQSLAPYPVLNKETGNVIYVQPVVYNQPSYSTSESSLSMPSVDGGMFSDVEYNIEVSERIKKWEKKVKPGEKEEHSSRSILNTIQEFESLSDTNQKDGVETPLEIRRELRQLMEHPDTSGIGKVSVSLAGSTSTMSDVSDYSMKDYCEPKVVSSETNLHRIFRVVQEPKQRHIRRAHVKGPTHISVQNKIPAQVSIRPNESRHAQSMSNVTLSETELGTNNQQTWPPMAVDSDSGVRKSWRMSRYEEELNELKEMVSDNFRDLKKRFDSDVSETDTKRDSSPVRTIPIQIKEKFEKGKPLVLNVEPTTNLKTRSPAPPRRKHFDTKFKTPPASPGISRVKPKFDSKHDQVKNIPGVDVKPVPEVWSPNLESRKGLVSMERVKARTLQTVPLSEDPVWKEMEGLATFNKGASAEDIMKEINFDDIDALLELATKGTNQLESSNIELSKAEKLMTSSFTQNQNDSKLTIPENRPRIMSDSSIQKKGMNPKTFPTPPIRPLKLRSDIPPRKSSASALDEVLEDIRSTLQKKTLSPKLLKNFDTSDSNSSTNISSPHTKSLKFDFPKSERPTQKVAMDTEELESTLENTLQTNRSAISQPAKPYVDVPYIDPDFTQYPYIINGNYHLDPSLLSEKLKSTGLVQELSDGRSSNQRYQNPLPVKPSVHQSQFPQMKAIDNTTQQGAQASKQSNQTQPRTQNIDESVVELKGLAREVEQKLSQIKSRIVSADEDRLDSVLLALRKFAPMTEQKYFDVKFTPVEADKVKKNKLEEALTELEKMYEILDLDDTSLLDRASRMEETSRIGRSAEVKYDPDLTRNVPPRADSSSGNVYRRSQIEEVERQTQNEFEDITKSFQVLIDEVTRQCHAVAQGSKQYKTTFSTMTDNTQKSNQQKNTGHLQSSRTREYDIQSQRYMQDSYNNAIKELESVAKKPSKPTQSTVYVNLNSSVQTKQPLNKTVETETKRIERPKNMNIQIQSKAVATTEILPNSGNVKQITVSKPSQSSANVSNSKTPPIEENVSRQSEQTEPKLRGTGRFRRRGNPEHRKSMPAMTRSVETQTHDTQTETSPSVQEIEETMKVDRQNSLVESSDGSEVKIPVKRKLSKGIAKMVDLFSSSEDERSKGSNLRHSHSAPDLTSLDDFQFEPPVKLSVNLEKRKSSKTSTPRSVKHRHEAKSRFRSLKDEAGHDEMTSSVTSEDGLMSPTNKPPVYPNWRYPGQIESPPPKKTDKRQGSVTETIKAASDTERETVRNTTEASEIVRRRTRSASDREETERPRSFHELMATFENDPKRLEKIKMCGLRKCASEDSMFTDLVLQKIYHSDTDLQASGLDKSRNRTGSGLKLALEIQVKGEK